jgi:hypothetical protein
VLCCFRQCAPFPAVARFSPKIDERYGRARQFS